MPTFEPNGVIFESWADVLVSLKAKMQLPWQFNDPRENLSLSFLFPSLDSLPDFQL